MRGVLLVLPGVLFGCATGSMPDDTTSMGDGGSPGRDGSSSGDSSRPNNDSGSCDKCGGSTCVDLKTDPNNCGKCGTACMNQTCCNGTCVDTTMDNANCGMCGAPCSGAMSCCNSSCVDTKMDLQNCGSCGAACNGKCTNGMCMKTCNVDLGSCSHSPCVTGAGLMSGCDPMMCVFAICLVQSSCCNNWDASCVQLAKSACMLSCGGC